MYGFHFFAVTRLKAEAADRGEQLTDQAAAYLLSIPPYQLRPDERERVESIRKQWHEHDITSTEDQLIKRSTV